MTLSTTHTLEHFDYYRPRIPDLTMEGIQREWGHIALRPHCGICSSPMKVSDRIQLLVGNADSTAFSHCLGPFLFPDYGYYPPFRSEVFLCRKPGCTNCLASPEAATVHFDCFKVVEKRRLTSGFLDQLWTVTVWRAPWDGAPHFRLQDPAPVNNVSLFEEFGLSGLQKLPVEVRLMIYDYSSTALLWRFNAAIRLSDDLSALSDSLTSVIPCSGMPSWNRDDTSSWGRDAQDPVIRLTIDSRGLKSVERLAQYPPFRSWRTDDLLFVILNENQLENILISFKFGHARLKLPRSCAGLVTWDTPTPPDLSRCCSYPSMFTDPAQLRTIDLRQTTGMTLFYSYGRIYAIHAHTKEAPSASQTVKRLSRRRRDSLIWVYVPLTSADKVLGFGVSRKTSQTHWDNGHSLLFRMKLAGDVVVGASQFQEQDLLLSRSPPSTIIYSCAELDPISTIGCFADNEVEESPNTAVSHFLIDDPPFPDSIVSIAPLDGIRGVWIFNDPINGRCMGVLLDYMSGAQRSLGQCRLRVDAAQYFAKPNRLCIHAMILEGYDLTLRRTLLEVGTDDCQHGVNEAEWSCFEMKGHLEFWSSPTETKVTVVTVIVEKD